MPDEALQVIRYTIEPQIATGDKNKPWVWMEQLKTHYTGSASSVLSDRYMFWETAITTGQSSGLVSESSTNSYVV